VTGVEDRVGTCNAYVVLTDAQAEQLLRRVLVDGAPGLLGIQEWDGPKPDLTELGKSSHAIDVLLEHATKATHYRFGRPVGGGPAGLGRQPLRPPEALQRGSRRRRVRRPPRRPQGPPPRLHRHRRAVRRRGPRRGRRPRRLPPHRRGAGAPATAPTPPTGPCPPAPPRAPRPAAPRPPAAAQGLPRLRRRRHQLRRHAAGTAHQLLDRPRGSGGRRNPRPPHPDIVYAPARARDVERIPTRSDHDAVVAIYPRRAA
jgi:hypothetical protein